MFLLISSPTVQCFKDVKRFNIKILIFLVKCYFKSNGFCLSKHTGLVNKKAKNGNDFSILFEKYLLFRFKTVQDWMRVKSQNRDFLKNF